jgi:Ni,Fe-hydrogenase I cytochrome b subunit
LDILDINGYWAPDFYIGKCEKGVREMAELKRIVHGLLALSLLVYIITGYGITEFRTVEPLTFRIVNKAISLKIHEALGIPFLALLLVHIYLSILKKE